VIIINRDQLPTPLEILHSSCLINRLIIEIEDIIDHILHSFLLLFLQ
jgi:hypothetical protein